jgi:hypothetical protein
MVIKSSSICELCEPLGGNGILVLEAERALEASGKGIIFPVEI